MPEAVLYSTGKLDHAGGPLRGSTYTCKAVSVGGLVVIYGKPDRAGGPVLKYTARYTEAGLCRRPYSRGLGSPSMRETHYQDLPICGCRRTPAAVSCVHGKPDRAGGPVMNMPSKLMEAGPSRRPSRGRVGRQAMWDTR